MKEIEKTEIKNTSEYREILVVGMGYVGLANGLVLSRNNNVDFFDVNKFKYEIFDVIKKENEILTENQALILKLYDDNKQRIKMLDKIENQNYKYVFLALPTDFSGDGLSLDLYYKFFEDNQFSENTKFIIKSTLNIGDTDKLVEKYKKEIYFSPEFLRESLEVLDVSHPSRFVIGGENEKVKKEIFDLYDYDFELDVLYTSNKDAEGIKLFSNTYLAMRIAFFNELDSYCMKNNLNTQNVIKGMSFDKRIGTVYNNPSFGFGGYCLPKDSKTIGNLYKDIKNNDIISNINKSNETRIDYLVDDIISKIEKENIKTIGFNRIIFKENSFNFKESSTYKLMKKMFNLDIKILLFEPIIDEKHNLNEIFEIDNKIKLENNFDLFAKNSDLIVSNRIDNNIVNSKVEDKLYTRDIKGL